MTKKENFLSILNYAKYIGLISATILVAVFQFIAKPVLIKLSLGFYAVSFMILAVAEFVKFADLVKNAKAKSVQTKKVESSDKQEEIEAEKARLKAEKVSKVMAIVMGVLYSIMSIFTLVVFVLY